MTDETNAMRAEMTTAIADVMGRHGAILTRWVLTAEIIDEDDRALWVLTPDDQKPWDSLGLLRFAENEELAAAIRDGDES